MRISFHGLVEINALFLGSNGAQKPHPPPLWGASILAMMNYLVMLREKTSGEVIKTNELNYMFIQFKRKYICISLRLIWDSNL